MYTKVGKIAHLYEIRTDDEYDFEQTIDDLTPYVNKYHPREVELNPYGKDFEWLLNDTRMRFWKLIGSLSKKMIP
jgi:hypothetical protein